MAINSNTNAVDMSGDALNVTQLGLGSATPGTAALAVIYCGSGAPTFAALQGSLYLNTTGSSTSTRLYVNTNGSTTWTNFTSAT